MALFRLAVATCLALLLGAAPLLGARAKVGPQCPRTGVTIQGTDRADVLRGTPRADVICGHGGNDTIRGLGGNDRIYGGNGNDRIIGGKGDDYISGGGGRDRIDGNDGRDHILGDGYTGADRQPPSAGRDIIHSGAGGDAVFGGPGNDIIDTGSALDGVGVAGGTDIGAGDAGNDVVIGTGPVYSSQFSGGDGHDLLFPFPVRTSPLGNSASGGSGNDVVILVNGLKDGAQLTSTPQIPIPNTPCAVALPLTPNPAPGETGQLQCGLPWKLPGGQTIASLEVAVGADGSLSYGGDLLSGIGRLNDVQLTELTSDQKSAESDLCLCDPDLPTLWSIGDVIL